MKWAINSLKLVYKSPESDVIHPIMVRKAPELVL